MMRYVLWIIALCVSLGSATPSEGTLLSPSLEEITQFSELAGYDLLHSEFAKSSKDEGTKVIAISDFFNLTDFALDSALVARVFLRQIKDSKLFTLTNVIAGNASNADPMLDSIRAMRNNSQRRAASPQILPKRQNL